VLGKVHRMQRDGSLPEIELARGPPRASAGRRRAPGLAAGGVGALKANRCTPLFSLDSNKPTGELRIEAVGGPDPAARVCVELCQWPMTNGCHNEATIGAYCDEHAGIAYRLMPTVKRNRTFRH
jgi:hypothetical protein